MEKIKKFKYLGLNGNLVTRIQLVEAKGIPMFELKAEDGKILTNGEKYSYSVTVYAEEVDNWVEIDYKGQI